MPRAHGIGSFYSSICQNNFDKTKIYKNGNQLLDLISCYISPATICTRITQMSPRENVLVGITIGMGYNITYHFGGNKR